jgi:hypothetical protein
VSTTTTFKFFWPDQDAEQEQWLREQARRGLHLKSVNILSLWTFVHDSPADDVYRVDFNAQRNNSDFHQLMRDAGWTYAASCTGWQYWRKAAAKGESPEIFTDSESKTGKFRRLLLLLGGGLAAQIPMLVRLARSPEELSTPHISLVEEVVIKSSVALLLVVYLIFAARLIHRIRRTRNAHGES